MHAELSFGDSCRRINASKSNKMVCIWQEGNLVHTTDGGVDRGPIEGGFISTCICTVIHGGKSKQDKYHTADGQVRSGARDYVLALCGVC